MLAGDQSTSAEGSSASTLNPDHPEQTAVSKALLAWVSQGVLLYAELKSQTEVFVGGIVKTECHWQDRQEDGHTKGMHGPGPLVLPLFHPCPHPCPFYKQAFVFIQFVILILILLFLVVDMDAERIKPQNPEFCLAKADHRTLASSLNCV